MNVGDQRLGANVRKTAAFVKYSRTAVDKVFKD